MKHNKTTNRQEQFLREYLECGVAAEAYRRVYSCNCKDPNLPAKRAHEMLERPHIRARLAELQSDALERHEVTLDDVIDLFKSLAFTDLTEVVTVRGEVLIKSPNGGQIIIPDFATLPARVHRAIKRVSVTKHGITIEMHDRIAAADRLVHLLGLKPDTQQQEPLVRFNFIGMPPPNDN